MQDEILHSPGEEGAARTAEPTILILPGLLNSGPGHWQSHWERLPGFRRVDFGAWTEPCPDQWTMRLGEAVDAADGPVAFAAHSLGCITLARWAASRRSDDHRGKLIGALLVAPPDIDAPGADPRVARFGPAPRQGLPFPSLLVASRNDPYCGFAEAARLAEGWGSELIDFGHRGHINAESGLGEWSRGLRLLSQLTAANPNGWIDALALRRAFA